MVSCPASLQGRVHSLEQISNIIIHFDRYPLITNKHADYLLFKEVIQMLLKKEHLTQEGLQAIVNIRGALNKGQTPLLKEAFPNSVAVPRPLVKLASTLPDPNWLAGFTAGEGCFLVNLRKSSSHKFGMRVMLRFKLTQHTRDEQLLKSLEAYLDCGKYFSSPNGDHGDFWVLKFEDIVVKIIPFFNKYPLMNVKSKDFQDFCRVAEIIKSGKHLTLEGIDKIKKIKAGMNKGRDA